MRRACVTKCSEIVRACKGNKTYLLQNLMSMKFSHEKEIEDFPWNTHYINELERRLSLGDLFFSVIINREIVYLLFY